MAYDLKNLNGEFKQRNNSIGNGQISGGEAQQDS